jgi:hypothetical protein
MNCESVWAVSSSILIYLIDLTGDYSGLFTSEIFGGVYFSALLLKLLFKFFFTGVKLSSSFFLMLLSLNVTLLLLVFFSLVLLLFSFCYGLNGLALAGVTSKF